MKTAVVLAGAILMLAAPAHAQDDSVVLFSQYYRCTQAQESRADEIIEGVFMPVLQRHVEAGNLTGFGWLAHVQGGPWRRALFSAGSDLATMMEMRAQVVEEISRDNADALNELGAVCPGHDDYIWTGLSNSPPDPDALGTASLSSYHICKRGDEARADEIFEEVLAPLYQKHMDMGHISSWGWYGHRSGGVFRRLETFSGADHTTLLSMQAAIYGEADPLAMQELYEACETHTDYMWQRVTQP
jgi:hypothetical protein